MERIQTHDRKNLAYNCQFDIDSFNKLSSLEGQIPPAEFAEKLSGWHQETLINLETNLGERYNAQIFEVKYPIVEGRIQNPHRNQPFLDNIVDGQQYRLGNNSQLNHNQKRELSEVISFSTIENQIQKTPSVNFINPSPPGGDYKSSFIDIFSHQVEDNQNFVLVRRFAVAANAENHWQIAQKITGNALPVETPPNERDIKLKETVIRTTKTHEEILKEYLPDKSAMSLKSYDDLKTKYRPWANEYIKAVMNGSLLTEAETLYENGLKFADFVQGKDIDRSGTISQTSQIIPQDIQKLSKIFAAQPLRPVTTACGIQGRNMPNSIDLLTATVYNLKFTNFSKEGEDKSDFRCPGTKDGEPCTYVVKYGSGIRKCPECGKRAVCA